MSLITARSGYLYRVLDGLLSLYSRDKVFDSDMVKIFLYNLKDGYAVKIMEKFTSSDETVFAESILLAPHDQPHVILNDFRKTIISWNTFLGIKLETILNLEELLVNKYKVSSKEIRQGKMMNIELNIKPLSEQLAKLEVEKLSNYDIEHLLISPRDFLKKYQ